MANKLIQMKIIKQIRLLDKPGKGKKTIARELGLSKNTVKSYLANDNRVIHSEGSGRQQVLIGFFPYCREELRRKGVIRQILWGEYNTPRSLRRVAFLKTIKSFSEAGVISNCSGKGNWFFRQNPGHEILVRSSTLILQNKTLCL